jgi:hypothetical protein
MKKISFFLLALCLASTTFFTSCTENDDEQTATINFDDVTLTDSILKTTSFTSDNMTFQNYFTDAGSYTYWNGFACSAKKNKTTAGYTNELSVYANGGASGNNFGVFYYSAYGSTAYCSFANNAEYKVKELKVNNNTYTYLSMKNGDAVCKKFVSGDWFKLTVLGYNSSGVKTDSVDYYLADFRNGKSYICSNWTSVNLEKLGKINKMTFKFSSSDNGDYGMNTPSYVCVDDIKYVLPNE